MSEQRTEALLPPLRDGRWVSWASPVHLQSTGDAEGGGGNALGEQRRVRSPGGALAPGHVWIEDFMGKWGEKLGAELYSFKKP